MIALFDKLPTILTLAILVGIFLALRKHSTSARIQLWTFAWALIFVHFLIQVFEGHTGTFEQVAESIDLAALELSGIVFAVSMSRWVDRRLHRSSLLLLLGIPAVFHATAVTFGWNIHGALVVALVILGATGTVYVIVEEGPRAKFTWILVATILAVSLWAIHNEWLGNSQIAVLAILTLSFGACGPLFWRRQPRSSTGVWAVVVGYVAWGAVFPIATAMQHYFPALNVNPELWNVPKFFVAIGMVLTLVEDQSLLLGLANARSNKENLLLQRLSQISSRLISGREPTTVCNEITDAITSLSSYRRSALFLAGEDCVLRLVSASGIASQDRDPLETRIRELCNDKFDNLRQYGRPVGHQSVVLIREQLAKIRKVPVATVHDGCVVIVPLISPRGQSVGCLWLATARAISIPNESELAKFEMLAADFAVTIENARLHHQLVRTEKLAALGQLVAGVAHELNNPLTGILGYTELLAEEAEKDSTRKRIEKLGREARRMKRIVDGLLRFARQNDAGKRATDVVVALHDVIQLREYHLRKLGIQLDTHFDPDLPRISIGEDELKQVFLNILNNAIDAVEESKTRTITVSATLHDDRVAIAFDDSGPGFPELNRAFDPFYTTKPVGKGTGLGLSICYGIIQECSGEITLSNADTFGARVTIEVPAVEATVTSAVLSLTA